MEWTVPKKYTNGKVLALENYHTDEMTPSSASTSSYYVSGVLMRTMKI